MFLMTLTHFHCRSPFLSDFPRAAVEVSIVFSLAKEKKTLRDRKILDFATLKGSKLMPSSKMPPEY